MPLGALEEASFRAGPLRPGVSRNTSIPRGIGWVEMQSISPLSFSEGSSFEIEAARLYVWPGNMSTRQCTPDVRQESGTPTLT